MPMFEGFFELQTAKDLLPKLQHDYDRLKKSPVDSYAAFDFFVTAYHMLDWEYDATQKKTTYEKRENWFLPVCGQLANGAKHFQASGKAVKKIIVYEGAFDLGFCAPTAFDADELRVELGEKAASEYGRPAIEVLELADKVLHFWKETFRRKG